MQDYDVAGLENEDQYAELKEAYAAYDKVQMQYFEKLAAAATKEEYNAVNDELAEELNATQEVFSFLYESLDPIKSKSKRQTYRLFLYKNNLLGCM